MKVFSKNNLKRAAGWAGAFALGCTLPATQAGWDFGMLYFRDRAIREQILQQTGLGGVVTSFDGGKYIVTELWADEQNNTCMNYRLKPRQLELRSSFMFSAASYYSGQACANG